MYGKQCQKQDEVLYKFCIIYSAVYTVELTMPVLNMYNNVLLQGRHYNSFEESNYVINNAQKNDSGEYECIADNSIGEPASAVITVEIVCK